MRADGAGAQAEELGNVLEGTVFVVAQAEDDRLLGRQLAFGALDRIL